MQIKQRTYQSDEDSISSPPTYDALLQENEALKEQLAEYMNVRQINWCQRIEHPTELWLARIVQQSMLPIFETSQFETNKVDLYADLDMSAEVGGDFYDFFEIEKFKLCFSVGDISGKGVSAALFQAIVKTVIKLRAMDRGCLSTICEEATRQLFYSQTTLGRMFATVWIGMIDTQTGIVSYVNAGHEPPVIIKSDASISLLTPISGLPIAAYYSPKRPEKNQYALHNTKLEVGDALLLYTDGATECRDRTGNTLGKDGLLRLVEQFYQGTAHQAITMKGLISYLQRSIIQYGNHAERDDDIAFLGLRRL